VVRSEKNLVYLHKRGVFGIVNKSTKLLNVVLTFVLFLLFSVVTMGVSPFAGQTVAPVDLLLRYPGWHSIAENSTPVHTERSDILDSQLPTWINLKEQLWRGELPLWYPLAAGGQPAVSEVFKPCFLLFASIKDHALAYYFVGLFKLVFSGFGCYLFLRTVLGWFPAVWGGMVFMSCGFVSAWFFWDQVATAMWIPWLLWATFRFLQFRRARWLALITLLSLLLIVSGFYSVAAYGFYAFALLVFVWSMLQLSHPSLIGQQSVNVSRFNWVLPCAVLPFIAVAASFLLAGFSLYPFVEYISSVDLSYRERAISAFALSDMVQFITADTPPVVERTAYAGPLVCLFAIAGVVRLRFVKGSMLYAFVLFNIIALLISAAIVFSLVPAQLVWKIPVFKSHPWGRLIVVTTLCLIALSAVGCAYVAETTKHYLQGRKSFPASAVKVILPLLVVSLLAVQLYPQVRLFRSFNAVVPSEWFFPLTPSIKYVKERLLPLQSVIADSSFMVSGTLGAYGIPEWFGHSFKSNNLKSQLEKIANKANTTATAMVVHRENIDYDSPMIDRLLVKYLLIYKQLSPYKHATLLQSVDAGRWSVVDLEKSIAILENNHVHGNAYFVKDLAEIDGAVDCANITLTKISDTEYIADYARNDIGWVIFPVARDGGWRALVNGTKVVYDDYLGIMPAVPVTGRSQIQFVYNSESLKKGLLVSAAGVIFFFAFILKVSRKNL
jgi:hypothetical protein